MATSKSDTRPTNEQVEELLSLRADLQISRARRGAIAERVKQYEAKYGIKSRSIHAAINRGQLKETHEICRWIMDYDLLRRSRDGENG